MPADSAFQILHESVAVLFAVAMPLLLVGLVVGVVIGLVQAATQVQEASLVFVPKLIAIGATFWVSAPWIAQKLIVFAKEVFTQVGQIGPGMGG